MITDKKVLYTHFEGMAGIDLKNIIEVAQTILSDREKEDKSFKYVQNGNDVSFNFTPVSSANTFKDAASVRDFKVGDVVTINPNVRLRAKNNSHHFAQFVVTKLGNTKVHIKMKIDENTMSSWYYAFDPCDIIKVDIK